MKILHSILFDYSSGMLEIHNKQALENSHTLGIKQNTSKQSISERKSYNGNWKII